MRSPARPQRTAERSLQKEEGGELRLRRLGQLSVRTFRRIKETPPPKKQSNQRLGPHTAGLGQGRVRRGRTEEQQQRRLRAQPPRSQLLRGRSGGRRPNLEKEGEGSFVSIPRVTTAVCRYCGV